MLTVKKMTSFDINGVLSINNASFVGHDRWDETELAAVERTKGVEILVLLDCHLTVHGFAVIRKSTKAIQLIRIAIHPNMRRAGAGRALLGYIKNLLKPMKQTMLWFDLSDKLLPVAHQWAVACGCEMESRMYGNITRFTFDMQVKVAA